MSERTSDHGSSRRAGVLMIMRTLGVPHTYIIERMQPTRRVTALAWQEPPPAEWELAEGRHRRRDIPDGDYFGREIRLRRPSSAREYPWTVTIASPRLLWRMLTAHEDVLLVVELNLGALFAVMSKVRRGRRVVAMVEGDAGFLGTTGSARVKVALRRIVARFVDVFASNSAAATAYLTATLNVDRDRIVEGWWLAAPPEAFAAADQFEPPREPGEVPLFVAAGQLIPRKGVDLLLKAIERYVRAYGPCRLQIVGDGPERSKLERQARDLGVADHVEFLGEVPHAEMIAMLRSCDLLVFPTLYDLVGRVVVEALAVGTPVAASSRSGAAHTLVRDGENGVVMDPCSPADVAAALRRATAVPLYGKIAAGARDVGAKLTPAAAVDVIERAIIAAERR